MKSKILLLRLCFVATFVVPLLLAAYLQYCVWGGAALDADSAEAYRLHLYTVVLTLVLVPLALRLHTFRAVKRYWNVRDLEQALDRYVQVSTLRLSALMVASLFGVNDYFFAQNTGGAWCTGIVLVAFLFCWPSAGKACYELEWSQAQCDELDKTQKRG